MYIHSMRKRILLVIIVACILTLIGIRFFSPEDSRICDDNTLIKHGNPSADGSGFFCSWWKLFTQSLLLSQHISMKITAEFHHNEMMPPQYTCNGEGRFPDLTVGDIPEFAKTLALIVDNPDAPSGVWDHLLLANIPVEGFVQTISQDTFDIALFGQNSRWELARWAPCPPKWTHRYVFKIYALSENLDLSSGFSKERLMELMWGKLIEKTELIWLYTR